MATKGQIGLQRLLSAQVEGLPFESVTCDAHYGQCAAFRAGLDQAGIRYWADVPANERVYLPCPTFDLPAGSGKGHPSEKARVREDTPSLSLTEVAALAQTSGQTRRLCPTQRGYLQQPFACRLVGTLRDAPPSRNGC